MIAKPRDVDAGDGAGLQHRHPLRDLDGVAVDEDLDGVVGVGEVNAGPRDRGSWGMDLGLGGSSGGFRFVEVGSGGDPTGG